MPAWSQTRFSFHTFWTMSPWPPLPAYGRGSQISVSPARGPVGERGWRGEARVCFYIVYYSQNRYCPFRRQRTHPCYYGPGVERREWGALEWAKRATRRTEQKKALPVAKWRLILTTRRAPQRLKRLKRKAITPSLGQKKNKKNKTTLHSRTGLLGPGYTASRHPSHW